MNQISLLLIFILIQSTLTKGLIFEDTILGEDFRNLTLKNEGGSLTAMSWHIHYTTDTKSMEKFYFSFRSKFLAFMPKD